MFSTDFIFRQQENLVDNQKCQAGFRPLCNKILFLKPSLSFKLTIIDKNKVNLSDHCKSFKNHSLSGPGYKVSVLLLAMSTHFNIMET